MAGLRADRILPHPLYLGPRWPLGLVQVGGDQVLSQGLSRWLEDCKSVLLLLTPPTRHPLRARGHLRPTPCRWILGPPALPFPLWTLHRGLLQSPVLSPGVRGWMATRKLPQLLQVVGWRRRHRTFLVASPKGTLCHAWLRLSRVARVVDSTPTRPPSLAPLTR